MDLKVKHNGINFWGFWEVWNAKGRTLCEGEIVGNSKTD